jgi:GNAT superfamily N-acetyltransferase
MKKDSSAKIAKPLKLVFRPLTPDRWNDFAVLFGERGACGGCWCMYWRLPRSEFVTHKGAGNKRALKKLTDKGIASGLLAYAGDEPVGWVALAPREEYCTLARSRVLKPVDDQPVWSVTCFFIAKPYRNRGICSQLLTAAVAYAGKQGARIVEGYPNELKSGRLPDPFVYTGLASAFRKAGFKEVLRRSATRPIMRYVIQQRLSRRPASASAIRAASLDTSAPEASALPVRHPPGAHSSE